MSSQVFVGIDVATAQWDMARRPTGERWVVTHDDAGLAPLVAQLQTVQPTLMVLEATGGYQRAVVAVLAAAGLPLAVVNPRQARDVANATGPLAKTDALDARALAHVAEVVRPRPRPLPDAQATERRTLLGRRRQLLAMRTAEQHRLGSASRRLQVDIAAHITWLPARLAALDDDLDTTLRARPVWREHAALLHRVPGIGPVDTRTRLLELPELGTLSRQRIAARVGGAPRQSGQRDPAGDSDGLGWSCPCPGHRRHEGAGRGPIPPGTQGFLRASARRGPGGQSCLDSLQAQAVDDSERHGETPHRLATSGGSGRFTY
jgi:transposase